VAHYHGGDLGDELAARLGLALGRRIRSGGSVRIGLPKHPVGLPSEWHHHPPVLDPPRDAPMIAGVADAARLPDAQELLESYPLLDAGDAVALVRAARQYVDGLWLADGDPRRAWIKLISALEVAANRYDAVRHGSTLAQLKRHRRRLWKKLEALPAQVQERIAAELAGTFNVQQNSRRLSRHRSRATAGAAGGRLPDPVGRSPKRSRDDLRAPLARSPRRLRLPVGAVRAAAPARR
jgi:hypothetical protein